jgi:hypothetical protein
MNDWTGRQLLEAVGVQSVKAVGCGLAGQSRSRFVETGARWRAIYIHNT